MHPFPYPDNATHKFWSRLATWLQRYSNSNVWNFRHSRASNSKMSGLSRPKIELDRAFMPVLVTSNIMMIRSKMNELAWRHHFPIKNLWDFFRRSRAANSVVSGPIWPKFELIRDFMHVLVTCIIFPIISQWGGGVLFPWSPEFWSNMPRNNIQPFSTPSDATHKIGQLTSEIFKFESVKVSSFKGK